MRQDVEKKSAMTARDYNNLGNAYAVSRRLNKAIEA
jgi:hypothetical protein